MCDYVKNEWSIMNIVVEWPVSTPYTALFAPVNKSTELSIMLYSLGSLTRMSTTMDRM